MRPIARELGIPIVHIHIMIAKCSTRGERLDHRANAVLRQVVPVAQRPRVAD